MPRLLFVVVVFLSACAHEVPRAPAVLSPLTAPERAQSIKSVHPVLVDVGTGYRRILPEGTTFVLVGTVAQGDVFKPTNFTLALEGRHIHEAYVVVQKDQIVGFFLPVEKAFVASLKQQDPGFIHKEGL